MIALFGGTFDPVHHGHLRIALECCEALALSELRFIPCRQSPLREPPQAGADRRMTMLQAAIAGEPRFRVDAREIERDGPSYTVDTLRSLRAEPVTITTPLCLILGMDAFLGLPCWHHWQTLVKLAHLVVVRRPGHAPVIGGELADYLNVARCGTPDELRTQEGGLLYFLDSSLLDISATDIRSRVATGRSIRYLVPDGVEAIIRRHGLYRGH